MHGISLRISKFLQYFLNLLCHILIIPNPKRRFKAAGRIGIGIAYFQKNPGVAPVGLIQDRGNFAAWSWGNHGGAEKRTKNFGRWYIEEGLQAGGTSQSHIWNRSKCWHRTTRTFQGGVPCADRERVRASGWKFHLCFGQGIRDQEVPRSLVRFKVQRFT